MVHHNQLPLDRDQRRHLAHAAFGSAPASRPGIGEHAAAPYMRAWDAIVSAGTSQGVRRLLDATDAAGADGLD